MQYKIPADTAAFFRNPPPLITGGSNRLKNAFNSFLTERIIDGGTAYGYSRAIIRFADWCSANAINMQSVGYDDVTRYRDILDDQISPAYTNFQLTAVRTFFEWLMKEGCIPANPASSVRSSKQPPEVASETLCAEQVAELFVSIDISTVYGLRNRAMLGAMMHGFIGTSNLVKLNREDYLRRDNRWWFNIGQEAEFRQIPANSELAEYMADYLKATELHDSSSPLFPILSSNKPSLQGTRMSVRNVQRIVKRCAKDAALESLTSRALRAFGLKTFLQIGGRIEQAQRIAGHANISTTSLYMDKSDNQIVYEGDLDGLVNLLIETASGPLEDFIKRSGVFRLSVRGQDETQ